MKCLEQAEWEISYDRCSCYFKQDSTSLISQLGGKAFRMHKRHILVMKRFVCIYLINNFCRVPKCFKL